MGAPYEDGRRCSRKITMMGKFGYRDLGLSYTLLEI
jgi:hypothetical protein